MQLKIGFPFMLGVLLFLNPYLMYDDLNFGNLIEMLIIWVIGLSLLLAMLRWLIINKIEIGENITVHRYLFKSITLEYKDITGVTQMIIKHPQYSIFLSFMANGDQLMDMIFQICKSAGNLNDKKYLDDIQKQNRAIFIVVIGIIIFKVLSDIVHF